MIIYDEKVQGAEIQFDTPPKPQPIGPQETEVGKMRRTLAYEPKTFFPEAEREPLSWGQEASNGIISGFNQIGGLSTFAAAMGADALGWDGVEASLLDSYTSIMKNGEKYRGTINSIEDIDSFDSFARWGIYTVSQQLPLFAVGGVGGTIGRIAGGKIAMRFFGDMVKELGAVEAGKVVAKRVALKNLYGESAKARAVRDASTAAGATLANYPMSAGEVGSGVFERTGEVEAGLGFGLGAVSASLDAVPQFIAIRSIFGDKIATQIAKGAIRKFGEAVAVQTFAEMTTEGLQAGIENTAINIKDPTFPILEEEGLSNILNSMAAGALVGGVTGVPANLRKLGAGTSGSLAVNQNQQDFAKKANGGLTSENEILGAEGAEAESEGDARLSGVLNRQAEIESQLEGMTPEDEGFVDLQRELEEISAFLSNPETAAKPTLPIDAALAGLKATPIVPDGEQQEAIIGDDKRTRAFVSREGRNPNEQETVLINRQLENDAKIEAAQEGEVVSQFMDDNKRAEAQLLGTEVTGTNPLRDGVPQGAQGSLPRSPQDLEAFNKRQEDLETSFVTALERSEGSEATPLSDRIKNRFNAVLSPAKAYLAERGVRFKSRSDIPGTRKNLTEVGVSWDDQGMPIFYLPKTKNFLTANSGDALADELEVILPKKMEEEFIHIEQIHTARQEAIAKGVKENEIGKYIEGVFAREGRQLRLNNPLLPTQLTSVYGNNLNTEDTDAGNSKLFMEFNRQVVQRARTGQITEDVIQLVRAKNNGSKAAEVWLGIMQKALLTIREAIARYFNPQTSPKKFQEFTEQVNQGLDAFGIVRPKQNESTPQAEVEAADIQVNQNDIGANQEVPASSAPAAITQERAASNERTEPSTEMFKPDVMIGEEVTLHHADGTTKNAKLKSFNPESGWQRFEADDGTVIIMPKFGFDDVEGWSRVPVSEMTNSPDFIVTNPLQVEDTTQGQKISELTNGQLKELAERSDTQHEMFGFRKGAGTAGKTHGDAARAEMARRSAARAMGARRKAKALAAVATIDQAQPIPDLASIQKAMDQKTEVGRGGNAIVYDIPGHPEFVLRVPNGRGSSKPNIGKITTGDFQGVADPYEGLNVGQAVSEHNGIQVLKRQNGSAAGLSILLKGVENQEANDNAYREAVEKAAAMPQSAYDTAAMEINKLNELGFQIDSSKSNNVLIDPPTGRFNFVDIGKAEGSSPGGHSLAVMLAGNTYFSRYKGESLSVAYQTIIDKVGSASAKAGLPLDESDPSFDYLKVKAGEVNQKIAAQKAAELTPEAQQEPEVAKTELELLNERHRETVESIKASNQYTPKERAKRLKGLAMRHAARVRQLTGNLTAKERQSKDKREEGNYIGKPVIAAGLPGIVVGNSFGNVRVQIEGGEIKSFPAMDVVAQQMEQQAERQAEPVIVTDNLEPDISNIPEIAPEPIIERTESAKIIAEEAALESLPDAAPVEDIFKAAPTLVAEAVESSSRFADFAEWARQIPSALRRFARAIWNQARNITIGLVLFGTQTNIGSVTLAEPSQKDAFLAAAVKQIGPKTIPSPASVVTRTQVESLPEQDIAALSLQAASLLSPESSKDLVSMSETAVNALPEIEAKAPGRIDDVPKTLQVRTKEAIGEPVNEFDYSPLPKDIQQSWLDNGPKSKSLEVAEEFVGESEGNSANPNEKIAKIFKQIGLKGSQDQVPWCAAFVSYAMTKAGFPTNRLNARGFLQSNRTTNPSRGDVAVFWNENQNTGGRKGWGGHAGFYLGETETHVIILSGNVADAVSVDAMPKTRLLGYSEVGARPASPIGNDSREANAPQSNESARMQEFEDDLANYNQLRSGLIFLGQMPEVGDPKEGKQTQSQRDEWRARAERYALEWRLEAENESGRTQRVSEDTISEISDSELSQAINVSAENRENSVLSKMGEAYGMEPEEIFSQAENLKLGFPIDFPNDNREANAPSSNEAAFVRHEELEAKHDAGTVTEAETMEAKALTEDAAADARYTEGVFHGTVKKESFTAFKSKLSGIWTAFSEDNANPGSGEPAGNVMSLFADLGNFPVIMSDRAMKAWRESASPLRAMRNYIEYGWREDGHVAPDGLFRPTSVRVGEYALVVTKPSQLKSAAAFTGVPLRDRFNPEDNRITFAPQSRVQFSPANTKESVKRAKEVVAKLANAFEGANETPRARRRGNADLATGDEIDYYMSLPVKTAALEAGRYIEAHPEGIVGAVQAAMNRKTGLEGAIETAVAAIAVRELNQMVPYRESKARTREQAADAKKLRELLMDAIDFVRMGGTREGRSGPIVYGLTTRLYGAAEAIKDYYEVGASGIRKLLRGDGTVIENLTNNLASVTGKEAAKVMRTAGFVRSVRAYVRRSVKEAKKVQRAMIRDLALNPLAALSEQEETNWRGIIAFAARTMFPENGDAHMDKVIKSIVEDVTFGMARRKATVNDAKSAVNLALSEATRDLLKEAGMMTGYEKAEQVPAIVKLKLVMGSDAARARFAAALEAQVATKFKDGVNDPEYIQLAKPNIDAIASRGYSQKILDKALGDQMQLMGLKMQELVSGTWGQGMEKADAILTKFEQELAGLPKDKIKIIVNDTSALLESAMAKKYLDLIGVRYNADGEVTGVKGVKRINEAIKDQAFLESVMEEAMGDANIAKQVKSLADIVGMSMRGRNNIKSSIAAALTEKIGLPREIANQFEQNVTAALDAQMDRIREIQLKGVKDQFERLNAAVEQNGGTRKATQSAIEKLIAQANKGFLDDADTYNMIRNLFPKANLPVFKPEIAEELRKLGERIEATPSGRIKNQLLVDTQTYISQQVPLTKGEIAITWMYFSMLSGPQTWLLVNPISNLASFIGHVAIHASRHPSRIPAMFSAIASASTNEAYKDFRLTFKTGIQTGRLEVVKNMLPVENINPDVQPWVYKLFTYSGARALTRFLGATDIYFNRLNDIAGRAAEGVGKYDPMDLAVARQQAVTEIRDSGQLMRLGDEVAGFAADLRAIEIIDQRYGAADPKYSQLLRNIQHYSQIATFTNEPVGVMGVVGNMIGGFTQDQPWGRAVVPFTHVVANVFNEQLNWTPWAFLRYSGWSPSRFGKDTKSSWMTNDLSGNPMKDKTLLWKGAYGTFLMATIALMAAQGIDEDDPWFAIYGAGPKNPNLRKQFFEQGGKPYTVKVGDTYLSYLISPVAMALASLGSYHDSIRNGDEPENIADMLSRAFGAMYNSVTSQSFLTSLQDFAGAGSSPNPERDLSRFFARYASLPVPNIVKQFDKMFNTQIYTTSQFTEDVMRDYPVINTFLPKSYNEAGEPITRKGGFFSRFVTVRERSPLWSFLTDNGLYITSYKNSALMGNEPMNVQQATEYIKTAGPQIKQWILANKDMLGDVAKEDKQAAQDMIAQESANIRRMVRMEMSLSQSNQSRR